MGAACRLDSAFTVAHPVVEVIDVREHIGMAHHNAFGPAGCAAGIDKGQNCVRVIEDRGAQRCLCPPRESHGSACSIGSLGSHRTIHLPRTSMTRTQFWPSSIPAAQPAGPKALW